MADFVLFMERGRNQPTGAGQTVEERKKYHDPPAGYFGKGLLIRRCLDEDKRNKQIFLTKQGKALENKALSIANTITELSENGIAPDELAQFKQVLHKIIENLE